MNSMNQAQKTQINTLTAALAHAAHLLPMQGPIGVFIHHNTLHAFQHLPFETAVLEASKVFGTAAYMSEAQFRKELQRGRIQEEDIEAVLAAEPYAEVWPGKLTRSALRRCLMLTPKRFLTAQNLDWAIEEEGLLEGDSARSLFFACESRLVAEAAAQPLVPTRPRDGVLAWTGTDIDEVIHPWLIRFCSVFVDQGLSDWALPRRDEGFYAAVHALLSAPGLLEPELLVGVQRTFRAHQGTPEALVRETLEHFEVPEARWEAFLTAELLALPGWAGLIHRLEEQPELAPYTPVRASLMEYLAVRLTLLRVAAKNAWRGQQGAVNTHWQRSSPDLPPQKQTLRLRAAQLFDAASRLGLSATALSGDAFEPWCAEVEAFSEHECCRLFHLAYERRHEQEILKPLRQHRRTLDLSAPRPRPVAQVVFCIDEREESMRRALEELDPEIETLGAAGFFGVAVHFQGLDDAHGVPLCPVVVQPQHAVFEVPHEGEQETHLLRQSRRRQWAALAHAASRGSRTLVRGVVTSIGWGVFALIPLVTRVLAPRTAGKVRRRLENALLPSPRTELALLRESEELIHGLLPGFSVDEKAARVGGMLRAGGLTRNHSRLIVLLGHGSTSLNNPHESAHDCGACGGRRGGPNARLFAAMANHPQVREKLASEGLVIPEDTWFVGGYHDTCSDEVLLFDTDKIPTGHQAEFERVRASLEAARAGNALERSRRFEAAEGDVTPQAALRHVQARSEHLAEPRPEYGHATNAVCMVGRRAITRGLFLDRRAFLVSYDSTQDPENNSLAALLGAAGPVCAGINLEYYFSFVDNERYGSGTKLPHNVTGLVGVMNGHASDLRTGLPWQMVEVHEPVRLLLVAETTPERLMEAVRRSALVTELVENRWIRLATLDPESGEVALYQNGSFVVLDEREVPLPEARSSVEWFGGKLHHLPMAKITGIK